MNGSLFTWGEIITIVKVPIGIRGSDVDFIKYHPWKSVNGTVHLGDVDTGETLFHCSEHSWNDTTMEAAIIRYIAFKNLGQNQHSLVSGILRALEVETASEKMEASARRKTGEPSQSETIFNAGYRAQANGKNMVSDNPYASDSNDHWTWRQGFLQAFHDSN